jgi:hypothetical protein
MTTCLPSGCPVRAILGSRRVTRSATHVTYPPNTQEVSVPHQEVANGGFPSTRPSDRPRHATPRDGLRPPLSPP